MTVGVAKPGGRGMLGAVPKLDCGLLDPHPSTVKRPSYATWKTFPRRA